MNIDELDKNEINDLIVKIEGLLEQDVVELDKFKARLAISPVHAFEWSQDAMYSAARTEVLTPYLNYLKSNVDDEIIGKRFLSLLKKDLEIKARNIKNYSTSNGHNEMERHRLVVLGNMCDYFRWM